VNHNINFKGGLVFLGKANHSTIKYWWAKIKRLPGIKGKLPLKDATRHGLASQALNRGVPLKYVSGALRHSTQKITEEVYNHPLKENIKEVFSNLKTRYGR
jgi:integrase